MKISKRLLFLLWVFVGASELVAMNVKWKQNVLVEGEEKTKLAADLAQVLGINLEKEEIRRIYNIGTLGDYLPKDQQNFNARLLLNENKEVECLNVADEMSRIPIYSATVFKKQNSLTGKNVLVVDARLLHLAISKKITSPLLRQLAILNHENKLPEEEIKTAITGLQTKIQGLEKEKSDLQSQWNNRSIIEKYSKFLVPVAFLVGGLLVGLIMKHAPQPEYLSMQMYNNK